MLAVLPLDTRFTRIPGDVGAPGTFALPVRIATVAGADVVAAGRRPCARHPDVGAIVLECANMPPYRDALAAQSGLPLFDATQAIAWFHSGLPRAAPAYGRGDSW